MTADSIVDKYHQLYEDGILHKSDKQKLRTRIVKTINMNSEFDKS